MIVLNNFVALKPLGALSINIKEKSAFATAEQKTSLASGEVVFRPAVDHNKPSLPIAPGDTVFFRADDLQGYARQIFSVQVNPEDKEPTQFILVPLDQIKLWRSKCAP